MDTRPDQKPMPVGQKLIFLGILALLSAAFFSVVWDNPFWNPGDFRLLNDAIDVASSTDQPFSSDPSEPFQPLVRLFFHAEYASFGLDAWKYYFLNIILHALNAFLVFLLVEVLLKDRTIAVLSAVLFVFAIGNYGKAVMVVSGVSDLLITFLTLSTLALYFKNELEHGGKLVSKWFFSAVFCFVLSLMTKTTSFGILGCMVAFNIFFRSETGKRIFNRELILMGLIAAAALVTKWGLGLEVAAQHEFVFDFFGFLKNYASYLVRMVFPIHTSSLVVHAGPVVYFLYQIVDEIRVLVFLTIVSVSFFGFVFGNRTLRFFIAWTYIMVTPFCFFAFPKYATDWLDIRHLYLVSVGFAMIVSSVTVLASRLLHHGGWVRRLLPYCLPLVFIVISQFIIIQLDGKYKLIAELPLIQQMAHDVEVRHLERADD